MVAHLAVVHGGEGGGVSHVSLLHQGIEHPVVGGFQALGDAAAQIGQGIAEHRTPCRHPVEGGHPSKAIGAGGKALKERAQQWLVVCLCADWCGTCKQYRQPFEALAAQFPQMRFVWLDVEDREDVAGDLDIETFPSILVAQGERARFLGPVLPQTGVLARMLQSLPTDAAARPAQEQEAQELLQRLLRADDLQDVLR
jgi:thiol-disulfide isomerase/thioredoxin